MEREIRLILRSLLRQPVVATISILTIALTVAVSTAILGMADAILFRPLPYPFPQQLVRILGFEKSFGQTPLSYVDYLDLKAAQQSFQSTAAYTTESLNVRIDSQTPRRIAAAIVTADFFPLLGQPALIGRTFRAEDDRASGSPLPVILSNAFWRTAFAREENVVGRTFLLNENLCEVIGVASAAVEHPRNVDLYLPMGFVAAMPDYNTRGDRRFYALGRLKPGRSGAVANEELNRIAASLAGQYPDTNAESSFSVANDLDKDTREYRGPSYLLLGAAGTVLLVAIVNVIGLRWNQVTGNARDWAIRSALGASRRRLAASMVLEGAVIALAGIAAGVALAVWLRSAAVLFLSSDIPRLAKPELHGVALIVLCLFIAGTTTLVGLVPALRFDYLSLGSELNNAGRSHSASRRTRRQTNLFFIAQTALSFSFFIVTLLFLRTVAELNRVDLGFDPNVLTAQVSLPATRYPTAQAQREFFARVLEELRAVPGVKQVAASNAPPFGPVKISTALRPVEFSGSNPAGERKVFSEYVTSDYFHTLGIPLLQGRTFGDVDSANSMPVAVIDELVAKRYWPAGGALGAHLTAPGEPGQELTVIGIVGSVLREKVSSEARSGCIYLCMAQRVTPFATLLIQPEQKRDPATLATALAAAVSRVDGDQPIYNVRPMRAAVSSTLRPQKIAASVFAIFASLLLLLMAVGLYGALAHIVRQRKQELGIRLALGATRFNILWSVLSRGLALTAIGIVLGIGGAFALLNMLRTTMPYFGQVSLPVLASGVAVLFGIATVASWLPAWRASRLDPNRVLSTAA
jgi:predicted permease